MDKHGSDASSSNEPEYQKELESKDGELIEAVEESEDLSDKQKDIILSRLQVCRSYSGPIPDPESLQKYREIDPSFPDRIMAMTEKALDANIEDSHIAARAESKGILAVSRGFAYAPYAFAFVILAGIFTDSAYAAIAGAFGTFFTLAPQIINALRRRDPNEGSGEANE